MEKLRKLFWALGSVLVVLFALTFSSCSDDDDKGDKDKGDMCKEMYGISQDDGTGKC